MGALPTASWAPGAPPAPACIVYLLRIRDLRGGRSRDRFENSRARGRRHVSGLGGSMGHEKVARRLRRLPRPAHQATTTANPVPVHAAGLTHVWHCIRGGTYVLPASSRAPGPRARPTVSVSPPAPPVCYCPAAGGCPAPSRFLPNNQPQAGPQEAGGSPSPIRIALARARSPEERASTRAARAGRAEARVVSCLLRHGRVAFVRASSTC